METLRVKGRPVTRGSFLSTGSAMSPLVGVIPSSVTSSPLISYFCSTPGLALITSIAFSSVMLASSGGYSTFSTILPFSSKGISTISPFPGSSTGTVLSVHSSSMVLKAFSRSLVSSSSHTATLVVSFLRNFKAPLAVVPSLNLTFTISRV